MSRNPHQPTPKNRKLVRYLAGVGLRQDDIAVIVDCSEKTLRLYYRVELDEGLAEANATIINSLLGLIGTRNVAAHIFYEKCRGGKVQKPKPAKKPPLFTSNTIMIPHCIAERCRDALDYMFGSELRKLGRQQAIAKLRSEIARRKLIPASIDEDRLRLIAEHHVVRRSEPVVVTSEDLDAEKQ